MHIQNGNGLFPQDISSSNIVTSNKHLEAIFEKEVRALTKEMIKQGLVEITQFENRDRFNSPVTVVVKVRAYKEE